jgi:2-polyprenyl-3-methyl-5-hydroxy-6-metoxy-1,4-benzoquinol methylase/glycosyltransferase involved in cell wall biosynthesis
MQLAKCPYCQSEVHRVVAKRLDGIPILCCSTCDLMWSSSIVDDPSVFYNTQEYYEKKEDAGTETVRIGYLKYTDLMPVDFLWQQEIVRLFQDKPGDLLDLGCATGNFMLLAEKLGYRATGLEISHVAVEIARRAGLRVIQASAEDDHVFEKQFDLITAWDLLEHIINLKELLVKCNDWLKPGGLFIFSTPDAGAEIVKNKGNAWTGFCSSLEHILYLQSSFLDYALNEVFSVTPIFISFTYAEDYATLIGIVRKGGALPSDWERASWLRNRSFPRTKELMQQFIEPLGHIYIYFQQTEAVERLIVNIDGDEQFIRFRSVLLGLVQLVRAQFVDAVTSLKIVALSDNPDSFIWQWLIIALESANRSLNRQNIEQEDQIRQTQLQIEELRDELDEVVKIKQEQTMESCALQSRIEEGDRLCKCLIDGNADLEQANRLLMSRNYEINQDNELIRNQTIQLQSKLNWKRYRIANIIVAPFWYLGNPKHTGMMLKEQAIDFARRYLPASIKKHIKRLAFHLSPDIQNVQLSFAGIECSKYKGLIIATSPVAFEEIYAQRIMSLSKAFSNMNYFVVFIGWRWSKSEFMANSGRLVYNNILQIPVDYMTDNLNSFFRFFADKFDQKLFFIEFPHPSFLDALFYSKECDFNVIYEIIDDWSEFNQVGQAPWYDEITEKLAVKNADIVTCINDSLAKKFMLLRKDINIVSNGLDLTMHKQVITKRKTNKKHIDLIYWGHLTDAWFDWDLIMKVANERKDFKFHIIGYGEPSNIKESLPGNVYMYGRKKPGQLFEYAKDKDVAIIPFKQTSLSRVVDPIKIYEYQYYGLPTVITGIRGIEERFQHVYFASDKELFVQKILDAYKSDVNADLLRDNVVQKHSYKKRAEEIMKTVEGKN